MSSVSTNLLFFFNDTATTEIYTLSLHDALPIYFEFLKSIRERQGHAQTVIWILPYRTIQQVQIGRATSELQSRVDLVCRLLLEKKKITMPDFRPCSTRLSHNQAPLCHCTMRMIS